MNRVWFTSDTHFGHKKVAAFRGFTFIDDHDNHLIDEWNKNISHGDRVYHLGDFALAKKERATEIRKQLNGQIYLIKGNHDKTVDSMKDCFVWVKDYFWLKVNEHKFHLSHYAHMVWKESHYGSFHLFGHSHGRLPVQPNKSMDVGMDTNNLKPYSLDEVVNNLKNKGLWNPDGHFTELN